MLAFIRKFFTRTKDSDAAQESAIAAEQLQDDETGDSAELLPENPHSNKAWLAIGLDGALAHSTAEGLRGPIGPPVHNTVQRLKDWVEHRELRVKILTPRAATEEGTRAVRQWLKENDLPNLKITHSKDLHMVEFWSAKCVQVISNTGQIVGSSTAGLDQSQKNTENPPSQADTLAAKAH